MSERPAKITKFSHGHRGQPGGDLFAGGTPNYVGGNRLFATTVGPQGQPGGNIFGSGFPTVVASGEGKNPFNTTVGPQDQPGRSGMSGPWDPSMGDLPQASKNPYFEDRVWIAHNIHDLRPKYGYTQQIVPGQFLFARLDDPSSIINTREVVDRPNLFSVPELHAYLTENTDDYPSILHLAEDFKTYGLAVSQEAFDHNSNSRRPVATALTNGGSPIFNHWGNEAQSSKYLTYIVKKGPSRSALFNLTTEPNNTTVVSFDRHNRDVGKFDRDEGLEGEQAPTQTRRSKLNEVWQLYPHVSDTRHVSHSKLKFTDRYIDLQAEDGSRNVSETAYGGAYVVGKVEDIYLEKQFAHNSGPALASLYDVSQQKQLQTVRVFVDPSEIQV